MLRKPLPTGPQSVRLPTPSPSTSARRLHLSRALVHKSVRDRYHFHSPASCATASSSNPPTCPSCRPVRLPVAPVRATAVVHSHSFYRRPHRRSTPSFRGICPFRRAIASSPAGRAAPDHRAFSRVSAKRQNRSSKPLRNTPPHRDCAPHLRSLTRPPCPSRSFQGLSFTATRAATPRLSNSFLDIVSRREHIVCSRCHASTRPVSRHMLARPLQPLTREIK